MALVDEGELQEAHEVLELLRTTMRDFRRRNGFRKFIADQLTAFHTIMGDIIAISKTNLVDSTIDTLYVLS